MQEEDLGESTLRRLKDAASATGDPAKEWVQGTREKASAYAQSAEESYEAMKRSAQNMTAHAKEAITDKGKQARALSYLRAAAGAAASGAAAAMSQAAKEKVSDLADRAGEAVKETVGDPGDLPSARAQFEASRSEETKAASDRDRKSQLTDEAVGDNPREQRTRDEHQILDSDFYTKA
ncbi:hypothetical protein ABPG77_008820 [Micractinium sp. CCAP 211/92]